MKDHLANTIHTETALRKCRTKFLCRSIGVLFKGFFLLFFFYTYGSLKCTHCPIAEHAGRILLQNHNLFLFLWLSLIFLIATQFINKIKQYQIDKKRDYCINKFCTSLYCSLYLLFYQEHVLFEMVYRYFIQVLFNCAS